MPDSGRGTTPHPFDKFAYIEGLRGRYDITNAEYRLLVTLWSYADANTGETYAGPARLAGDVATDPKNGAKDVKDRLRSLERLGYLVLTQRGGSRDGRRLANVYRLALPTGGTRSPQSGTTGGSHTPQSGTTGGSHTPQSGTTGGSHTPQSHDAELDALGGATPPGLGGATPPGLGGATPPPIDHSTDHDHQVQALGAQRQVRAREPWANDEHDDEEPNHDDEEPNPSSPAPAWARRTGLTLGTGTPGRGRPTDHERERERETKLENERARQQAALAALIQTDGAMP